MKLTRMRFVRAMSFPIVMSVAVTSVNLPAAGELPENYTRRWNDPAVQERIDEGIEKHRKGDAVLRIVDASGQPVPGAEVEILQVSHEFLFGSNIFVLGQMEGKNKAYEDSFLQLFNFATIPFYWGDLEPEPDRLRFVEGSPYIWRRPPPDRAVAFGKKHGLTLKGHPLLWHHRDLNPPWMPTDPKELKQRYIKRFKEIANRYADDILIWDGVNESLVCQSYYPLFSPENREYPCYVPWAFMEQQRAFSPENLLIINEVPNFNWPPNETNMYYRQCARLLDDGVGIEGIGFQLHLFGRSSLDEHLASDRCDPGRLLDTYELFAKLGLPLWITEITIGSAGEDGLAIQRRVVRDIYRLWFSAPQMAGITWWNLGDNTAYGNEGVARGGLTDEEFNPKPSYRALDQLINQDWKTNLEARSGADGTVRFRGFLGRYQIQVRADERTTSFEVNLGAKGSEETLRMP